MIMDALGSGADGDATREASAPCYSLGHDYAFS